MGFVRKTWNKITGKDKLEEAMNKPPPPPPAVEAAIADQKPTDATVTETASEGTAVRRKGKKGLTVSRSSGTGLNV